MSRDQFQVRILFSNKNFFLPFLWQVGEFSLVCEEGREGGLLCTCRSFTTFYKLFQQREKRFKGGGGKTENLQNVSVRKKKGGDEAMALIWHRFGRFQPAETP